MQRFSNYWLVYLIAFGCLCAQPSGVIYDVRDFGAVGDDESLNTEAIQRAIDTCSEDGGGKVYFERGTYVSGTIILKDGVTLHIDKTAILKASDDLDDFPSMPSKYSAYQRTMETNKMFIYAEDAKYIGIEGSGTIDGNGDHWAEGPYGFPSFSLRPRLLHFRYCQYISIKDVTLYNSASWVQSYQSCKDMIIDGITVNSRENKDIEAERYATVPGRNTDGLDLNDCVRVRISNSTIISGDDGICLKSFYPDQACRDIVITNCIISTNASGIKIGTESAGRFEDITVSNCVVYDTRRDAISVMTVDGAQIERINISNITCRNIKTSAIFLRLGKRMRPYREGIELNEPYMRDISITNVQGTRIAAAYGCIIAGLPGYPIENIHLENINLTYEGGMEEVVDFSEIPLYEEKYPNGLIFGTIPAYGYYIRDAKNLTMENIQMHLLKPDARPTILMERVEKAHFSDIHADLSVDVESLFKAHNSGQIEIDAMSIFESPVPLLSVSGGESGPMVLQLNPYLEMEEAVLYADEVSPDSIYVMNQ